jgi:hypothetical protein
MDENHMNPNFVVLISDLALEHDQFWGFIWTGAINKAIEKWHKSK